jgi:hypothetical protein
LILMKISFICIMVWVDNSWAYIFFVVPGCLSVSLCVMVYRYAKHRTGATHSCWSSKASWIGYTRIQTTTTLAWHLQVYW